MVRYELKKLRCTKEMVAELEFPFCRNLCVLFHNLSANFLDAPLQRKSHGIRTNSRRGHFIAPQNFMYRV